MTFRRGCIARNMLESHDLLPGAPSLTREDPSAFSPPPAFGPFRVLHQVGVGALGPVFRTYEPTRDRLVAVKVFRLDIVPEQAQSLADELSRATEAGLFHPSIVEPIAAGVEGTLAYRAEEYVAAESLDVAMRHYAPAPIDKALPFMTQLAGAIDFARAAGVRHGGLHPRDIFVTPDEARATGFGVVEALERAGLRAPVRRPYSAPERIESAEWGTPADVFALAAITFELLTARRPAGTGDQIGALTDAAGPHATLLHGVLARAMDPDPSRRYPTALAFAAALEAAARGSTATPLVVPTAVPPQPKVEDKVVPIQPKPAPPAVVVAPAAQGEPVKADSVKAEPVADRPLTIHSANPQSIKEEPSTSVTAKAKEDAAKEPPSRDFAIAPPPVQEPSVKGQPAKSTPKPKPSLFDEREPAAAVPIVTTGRPVAPPEGVDHLGFRPVIEPDDALADQFDLEPASAPEPPTPRRADPVVAAVPPAEAPVPVRFAAEERYTPDSYGLDADSRDTPERSRPAVLPIAVTLVVGLLLGFMTGYFVRGHGTESSGTVGAVPAGTSAAAAPPPAATPSARQYSDHAVTAPPQAPSQGARSSVPPPTVTEDTPAASKSAAATPPPARPVPTPPPVTSGRILVRSTPEKAGVTVNGRWRGRTPLTLERQPFGHYVIRVTQPGYRAEEDEFALSAKVAAHSTNVRLSKEPAAGPPSANRARTTPPEDTSAGFTGVLYVDSRPTGANVLLDGHVVGKTPLRLPDVRIGSHVVRIELAEHQAWTSSTRVTSGQETRVTGSLERIQ